MTNHKILSTVGKAAIMAAFMLISIVMSDFSLSAKNRPEMPDFAFPEKVEKDASDSLKLYLAKGDDVMALNSAIRIIAARNRISSDSFSRNVSLLDSLSGSMKAPYSGLAKLVEATLYNQLYDSNRWQFNSRTLPLDTFPEDPMAWSDGLFAKKVLGLVDSAMADSSAAKEIEIKTIAPLLVNCEYAEKIGLTVYDFMVTAGARLLDTYSTYQSSGTIPFFKNAPTAALTPGEECAVKKNEIINALYEWRVKVGDEAPLISAINQKSFELSTQERKTFLKGWLDKLPDSPEKGRLYHLYYLSLNSNPEGDEGNIGMKELLVKMENWVREYPKSEFTSEVKSDIWDATRQRASLTLPNLVTGMKEIKGKMEMNNMKEAYVLLYSVPERIVPMNSLNMKEFPSKGKLVKTIKVTAEGELPFSVTKEFTLPGLAPGYYVAIPSSKPRLASNWRKEIESWSISVINVSDIAVLSAYNSGQKDSGKFYVVDAVTQKPVQGARVEFYSDKNLKVPVSSKITDKEGSVKQPTGFLRVRASKGKSVVWRQTDLYYNDNPERETYSAKVLTDLSIYKPGDNVGFAIIAWANKGHDNRLLVETEVTAELRDANWRTVDTKLLKTDKYGRCTGNFTIPDNGLLGTFTIIASSKTVNSNQLGRANFQVAEYKAPTFFVTVESDKESVFKVGEPVIFTGEVKTYSGMALPDSKVTFNVEWNQWWRWWHEGVNSATYNGSVQVDPDGKFRIELPTDNLKGTPFERGLFSLTVTATSPAGETQTSSPLRFALGKGFTLRPNIPETLKVTGDSLKFNVPVYDILDHPSTEKVEYSVVNTADNDIILKGSFESPNLLVPSSKLPSGKYEFIFSLEGDTLKEKREVAVWRPDDRRPPYPTQLWVPEEEIIVPTGTASVSVRVGSGYAGSWVLCQISEENSVIESKWLYINDENIELKVEAPKAGSRRWVNLIGMRDHSVKRAAVKLIPEEATKKMQVTVSSFRDKITAGDKEKWSFNFKVGETPQNNIPALAVMSNKALNVLAPFKWNFTLGQNSWFDRSRFTYQNPQQRTTGANFGVRPKVTSVNTGFPDWQTYDMMLAGGGGYGGIMIRGLAKSRSMNDAVAEESVEYEFVENQVFMSTSAKASMGVMKSDDAMDAVAETTAEAPLLAESGAGATEKREEPRPVEMPLAYFMPMLTSDGAGNVNVEFVTPNFNTTWQFQIMGYNDKLLSSGTVLEAVASKPVMVQVNAPRYLRTGDKAVITALMFNNSPDNLNLHGEIEVFDPLTGETITSKHAGAEITAPGANRVVTLDFPVGSNGNALGVRAYAYAEDYSDGEQTLIPVLPSSTPVVESTQFYLGNDKENFSKKLPKYNKDANLTLKYCDNPVWECVMALPSISKPESKNVLSVSRSFFANGIAQGIITKYPQVQEGIKKAFEAKRAGDDRTLTSNLSKDSVLKTVALINTPWVNDAASETMRLESLKDLLDTDRVAEAVKSMQNQLITLQNPDGGWSWCDGMKSSEYITSKVLGDIASVKRYGEGFDADNMVSKAVAYCDKELYDTYIKNDKKFSTITMLRYLYIRDSFPGVKEQNGFATLKKEALKKINEEWKEFSIYDLATAAILLSHTDDYKETSSMILESLRQLASKSETKGWWYDNLRGGWNAMPKLLTTARALEAFSEIQPDLEAVDGLRQWLVLSKETENWGADVSSAGVISAILGSGSDWLGNNRAPEISLGGKTLDVNGDEALTGIITLQISPSDASGKVLKINKTGNGPAWGGVISQYVAPVGSVKAESCENLKLEKNILLVKEGETGETVESVKLTGKRSLKVGDKVRVTLTLTCKKDMEYVALIDERAACLEPVDQLSAYDYKDGLGTYREVRDTKTSFFINYLPKGVNVISYDCYVDREGVYALGIASAQSQYSPLQSAHSAGGEIKVESQQ